MTAKMKINGQPARLTGENTDKTMLLPIKPHNAPTGLRPNLISLLNRPSQHERAIKRIRTKPQFQSINPF